MIQPRRTTLYLKPERVNVLAEIVPLTKRMADIKIRRDWLDDDCLDPAAFQQAPIDRHWDWNSIEIEYGGVQLPSERIAIVAGDDRAVQGAMMISRTGIESAVEPNRQALLVELLFTAPRNRPQLRKDKTEFLLGVGIKLLSWAAWFSNDEGYAGRLRLDASQEFLGWYENRGLKRLDLPSIPYEGNNYSPMELPVAAAQSLLNSSWEL